MILVVTGPIGCGKSAVVASLHALGARTADADAIVHSLYERSAVRTQVAAALGLQEPFTRADIAAIVFHDPAALRRLEGILHPLVYAEFAQLRAQALPGETWVFEVPLPPTTSSGDVVICVEADDDVRRLRLGQRGMAPDDIAARMQAAPSLDQYRAHADRIVQNNGTLLELQQQMTALWTELQRDSRTV